MRTKKTKKRALIGFSSDFLEWGELRPWLAELNNTLEWVHKPRHEVYYLNVAASFDIETTSWRNPEGEKRANMYIWMVCLHGKSFCGRTWFEFIQFCQMITETLGLNENRRLVLYVHNLSFEFQFLAHLFEWQQVFALDIRVPVYAATTTGIEFRCSYILHGAGLEHMGKSLVTYKLEKKVGDLDYSQMRHSGTPLTKEELGYCIADVQVVVAYIDECIRYEKRITKIPLTKTGYPRRLMKKAMLYGKGGWHNRKLLEGMTYELAEFLLQREEFAGGFTHGAHRYITQVLYNVRSKDETSAYPTAGIAFPVFPMGKGKKVMPKDMAHFRRMLDNYACLFRIRLRNVREKPGVPDHILSYSKCRNCVNQKLDNGRIISADSLETSMNEIDFKCFEKFYDFDPHFEVSEMYRYRRGYMPKAFIETVLQLYNDKTLLKNVPGREQDYAMAKANLNSLYGMLVYNAIRDDIVYEGDWKRNLVNYAEKLEKYNESPSRFVSYNWGCWITSIARANLYEAILELGDDFVYSDTDSVKYLNAEKHESFFEMYNKRMEKQLREMCEFYNLDFELCRPKGQLIGVWDDEGTYTRFKTLGAKRYMTEKNGNISITVSGLNKKATVPWMIEAFEDPFTAFDNELDVPAEATGKLTHTYIDIPFKDFMTDYLGNTQIVSEQSCVHLEPAEYSLSMAKEFLLYINQFLGG